MNNVDMRLKAMAGAEVCPVPEGFEARVERRLQDVTKGRAHKAHPARWVLVAACLCAALVGTALAVETVTGIFSRLVGIPATEEGGLPGYFLYDEVVPISVETVSEELRAKGGELTEDQVGPGGGGFSECAVSGYKQAEALLGVPLMRSRALEAWTEEPEGTFSLVWQDGVLCMADLRYGWTCLRDGETLQLSVYATAYTDQWQDGYEYAYQFAGGAEATELAEEQYVTAGGLPVTLVTWSDGDVWTSYIGHFTLGGIRYTVFCSNGIDRPAEPARAALLEVLDGIVLEAN